MKEPNFKKDSFEFYNADNMDIMKGYPDKYFDLCIVDPPYGIGVDGARKTKGKRGGRKGYEFKGWDTGIPQKRIF